jgi:tetratricopeptide (TPR) repeat protein
MGEAIVEYREAIATKLDFPEAYKAHQNLGQALLDTGQLEEAITECREALRLEKNNAEIRDLLRQAEQLVQLNKRLPAVLERKDSPKNAAECLGFAQLCLPPYRRQYAAAARFYEQAFAREPKLVEDPRIPNRYNAACAAAMAGCGQGQDADKFGEEERAILRHKALDWLRADLTACSKELAKNKPDTRAEVRGMMQHWLADTDFAGVRGSEALAKLPEAERQPWQKLWDDVADTLKRAEESASPEKK